MLYKKALRKIFITTLTMIIILTVYTIPVTQKEKVLRTNLEIEEVTNLKTDSIYLLNKENYLVKTDIFINSNSLEDKIEKIINYLTLTNDKTPINLTSYIPKNTKLINYNIESNSLLLNFSKEFTNSKIEDIMITGIVYSLLELNEIKEVSFQVENNFYKKYTNRNNINKVVIYYLDKSDNYYVPVTNYVNDDREKIEIIIDELKNTKKGLISYINENTKLLDYNNENNLFILNFNNKLKDDNKLSEEKILNTISYSVFDNYDVNMVMFQIEGETYKYIKR